MLKPCISSGLFRIIESNFSLVHTMISALLMFEFSPPLSPKDKPIFKSASSLNLTESYNLENSSKLNKYSYEVIQSKSVKSPQSTYNNDFINNTCVAAYAQTMFLIQKHMCCWENLAPRDHTLS